MTLGYCCRGCDYGGPCERTGTRRDNVYERTLGQANDLRTYDVDCGSCKKNIGVAMSNMPGQITMPAKCQHCGTAHFVVTRKEPSK